MNDLRIVSLLPAATEIAFSLGLGDAVVGVSHECDFPASARTKPVLSRPVLPLDSMSPQEIDLAVAERLRAGQSLYAIDEALLQRLRPNLLLTQNLCQVCAPSGNELAVALQSLPLNPEIVVMSPHSLADIFDDMLALARLCGRSAPAQILVVEFRERLGNVARRAQALPRRRVFCLEWADPIYCSGHWVPEMIELAGGIDRLGHPRADSVRIPWESVVQWAPEVLILSPCGFDVARALEHISPLQKLPGWLELPAVRDHRVFCVDANSYFARPGPRLVDGTELLAHLIHPEVFGWSGPPDAFGVVAADPEEDELQG